jgi:hypothetical protein
VLVRFSGEFVSAEMISFIVRNSCGCVGVGSKVVQFGDSIVRALWHGFLLANRFLSESKVGNVAKIFRTS